MKLPSGYTVVPMLMTSLRYRGARTTLVTVLMLGILLAQGLRMCLHVPHASDAGHTHATAFHLESDLALLADSDDDAGDRHLTLGLALIKKLTDGAALAILPAAALLLLLPLPERRFAVARDTVPPPSSGGRLRPPLRAPPH